MNYRHQFHAGNYADVVKHALLVRLVRALHNKEKGFLYLDTHAGRGRYDLAAAAAGESLARKPEWPDGIGRLWGLAAGASDPEWLEYLEVIRQFDVRSGNLGTTPRFYPGSPWIVRLLARPADRLAFCEKHPAEFAALRAEFAKTPRVSLHEIDGYAAIRSMLPPPERRALVLIDPPFESQDEFARIAAALGEGLVRFRSGVFAVWYPLTTRARVDEFIGAVRAVNPPSALAVELTVAGPRSLLKMQGCGLLVINPPWGSDREAVGLAAALARVLAQEPGGGGRVEWIVREESPKKSE
jgi:23S rRNA (adenine2030-N6)-methyltransferase